MEKIRHPKHTLDENIPFDFWQPCTSKETLGYIINVTPDTESLGLLKTSEALVLDKQKQILLLDI